MKRGDPETDRGLEPAICGARHGIAAPRGQGPVAGAGGGGRFGRMFAFLPPHDLRDDEIDALVTSMKGPSRDNGRVPAGYTYLGQFVDHDITFDPLSQLQRDNDPHALVNFRTPRFDLDSLYGSGPVDQPFLYDWRCDSRPGVKLLVGHDPPGCDLAPVDLPRNEQGRALVGDARNDENLIIAQLHLLFIRFHNKAVDRIHRARPALTHTELLAEAQRFVRWHYQWIVVHDYLRRIVGEDLACNVLAPGADGAPPTVRRRFFRWRRRPEMPVEFSGATFRFGHSMVRDDYRLTSAECGVSVPIFRRPGQPGDDLAGFRRLPADLAIDWSLFFFEPQDRPELANDSMRFDTLLVAPLFRLPPDGAQQLARLNLQRGRALGLPSGPDVARAMSITPLTEQKLLSATGISAASMAVLRAMLPALPLWVYVLLEAKLEGQGGLRLGPVGGQIVAEVLVGLLEADPHSYLRQWPTWTPELSDRKDHDFTMPDLLAYLDDPERL